MTSDDKAELGRINKPEAGDIMAKRKIYIALMVNPSPEAPDGYSERYEKYWKAVDRQLTSLEERAGTVARVFAEGILGRGDDAKLMLEQSNPAAWRVARDRWESGATVEQYEDSDLLGQVIDWSRCLQLGFMSETVANTVRDAYIKASEDRQQAQLDAIEKHLGETEAGFLLAGTTNVKLPEGVERFVIYPPELDELQRWVRQTNEAIQREIEEQQRTQSGQQAPQQGERRSRPDSGGASGGGLWTPGSR